MKTPRATAQRVEPRGGPAVRVLRRRTPFTQADMARLLRVHRQRINSVEAGYRPASALHIVVTLGLFVISQLARPDAP